MERYIAIDNVCAWPNSTLMPDGSIVVTIFNQPCHGTTEGDGECWASEDGGRLWRLRGVPAPHEPGTNRMNVAAGLAPDGALIVIASGWGGEGMRECILEPWVCRSTDGGRTWARGGSVEIPDEVPYVIPFGDIISLVDGRLATSFYCAKGRRGSTSYILFSEDGGLSWGNGSCVAEGDHNETDLLRGGEGLLLAAVRTARDGHLELFTSEDDGFLWARRTALTLAGQHPAHLMTLADGRILLVYGIRNPRLYGIGARLSDDGGQNWSRPILLVDLDDAGDGGYPSSVQLSDGTIVTSYYANRISAHRRYHMGVVRWTLDEVS